MAAVLGDSLGYAFGKKVGPAIFVKENSLFFDKKHIARAQHFYEKHGKKTIILARFVPIVRTFAPIFAGVGEMPYKIFLSYNVIGGFFWAIGLSGAGYFLGRSIPNVDRYLLPIVILIIIVSFLPIIFEYFKNKNARR